MEREHVLDGLGCGADCTCSSSMQRQDQESSEGASSRIRNLGMGAGVVLYLVAIILNLSETAAGILYGLSYLLIGGEIVLRALRNITRGRLFDENSLMSIATLGALAIREYPEAVAVMLFYRVGEYFHDMAVNRSRRSISALMDIRPDFANLMRGEEILQVAPEEVAMGDIILVKPGERVPLDGSIVTGTSLVDTSALTGESVPRNVKEGDHLLSGSINMSGILQVEVLKKYGESTVAKILDLVEAAGSRKAPTEKFITKFARYYTPAVVTIAFALAVIPPLVIPGALFSDWLYRALVFLVISCPCALVVSIPLGFFGGIGAASRNGVLVKGGNYLEALNNVDTVVFDKTGTLTKGVFKVTALHPAKGFSEEELLEHAALAEAYSQHPIARSILESFGGTVAEGRIASYEEIAGYGVRAVTEGQDILAGNMKLMEKFGIVVDGEESSEAGGDTRPVVGHAETAETVRSLGYSDTLGIVGESGQSRTFAEMAAAGHSEFGGTAAGAGHSETLGTVVHVAVAGRYAGYILISDEVKEDALRGLQKLRNMGIRRLVMLTGDSAAVARQVAAGLGLDEVFAGLLPHEKVEKVEEILKAKGKGNVVVMGDGINDAPVLARADIGVAMGGLGSDAAIEAADVVLMTDEPSKLATAINIARRTRSIVFQNIIFVLGVKGIILVMGALGAASMWEAVFADVGVTLLAVLNVMRILRTKEA